MALVKCKECGNQISSSAASCPQCGAKVKRTSLLTKIIVFLFIVGFLSAVFSSKKDVTQSTTPTRPSASEQARLATMTPEQRAQEEKQLREKAAAEEDLRLQGLGLRWNYHELPDQMGRGTIRMANVLSVNEIEFGFPYQGSQRGILQLRIHPEYGKSVILTIHRGQFLCGLDECVVLVRFDEGKPQTYRASEPTDNSTTYIFLHPYDRFLTGLRKSKKVYIEAQFYQEGSRVIEFDTSGLKW